MSREPKAWERRGRGQQDELTRTRKVRRTERERRVPEHLPLESQASPTAGSTLRSPLLLKEPGVAMGSVNVAKG